MANRKCVSIGAFNCVITYVNCKILLDKTTLPACTDDAGSLLYQPRIRLLAALFRRIIELTQLRCVFR